jgi:hypothetical protein
MFHGLFRLGEKKATTFSNVFTTLSNILMHSHLMLSQCWMKNLGGILGGILGGTQWKMGDSLMWSEC